MNEDIDRWVARLRRTGYSDPGDKNEVGVIRKLLMEHQEDLPPPDDHQFERLRFRLEREGLLRKPRWQISRPALYAFAATFAVVAISVGLFVPLLEGPKSPITDDAVAVRGVGTLQTLRVEDPAKLSLDVEEALKGVGITPRRIVEAEGTIFIEARVPEEARARLHAKFDEMGVQLPVNGRLRLLLTKAKS